MQVGIDDNRIQHYNCIISDLQEKREIATESHCIVLVLIDLIYKTERYTVPIS